MPLGNGALGINLWVEGGGDLLFYLGRNDAYSEVSQLCKVGRVRISLSPNPFATGTRFRQELNLRTGICTITAGADDRRVVLRVFVDAATPVIHVTGECALPTAISVRVESWRTAPQPVAEESSWTLARGPHDLLQSADHFPDVGPDAVCWYHRNDHAFAFDETIRVQSLEAIRDTLWNPLVHRTFGGWVTGAGFVADGPLTLISATPRHTFALRVASPCEQTKTARDWLLLAQDTARAHADPTAAAERTALWWRAFQDRSWVHCDVPPGPEVPVNTAHANIGKRADGGQPFGGGIGAITLHGRPLSSADIATRAEAGVQRQQAPAIGMPADVTRGLTIEGWVCPDHTGGTILAKVRPGTDDGILCDMPAGHALRLVVGNAALQTPVDALTAGQWHHIAATYDSRDGAMTILIDGQKLAHAHSPLSATGRSRHDLFHGQDRVSPTVADMTIGKAHALQRYMQACAGRGILPIKFNGSIFTVEPAPLPAAHTHNESDPATVRDNPDWRRWGDCHWWQNVRMPYHAMQATGDFDLMLPLFDMFERIRPFAEARARLYHGVDGCYFPETLTIWGAYANGDYGWDRSGKHMNEVNAPYWRYAWNQGLELVALMLDYHDHTQDAAFVRERLLPMALSVLRYFDSRFGKDADGRIILDPTQSKETYWQGVINDTPSISGLIEVTSRLGRLPDGLTTVEERQFIGHMAAATPDLPFEVVEIDGQIRRKIAVAQTYEPIRTNVENPELFPVWPFRLSGLHRPLLDEGRNAYRLRGSCNDVGWGYDSNAAALLGLTEEAAGIVKSRMANSNAAYRWPATWGPNFDWLPDQCHGGNLMATINYMLLQSVGDAILILPAWPQHWDVSFRLHAPRQTTVDVTLAGGKVTALTVSPADRRKDVVLPDWA
ncbi:MAG: hypothetical protein JJT81_13750 [Rubellimicrobium sp.]|nr:hypothetical protein [Rubellimicrobium sp.]